MTDPLTSMAESMAARLGRNHPHTVIGSLTEIGPGGLVSTLTGLGIGDICRLVDEEAGTETLGQVLAIRDGKAVLAPFGAIQGLSAKTAVLHENGPFSFWCGTAMLGGVYDGLGRPADGRELDRKGMMKIGVDHRTPSPLDRPLIEKPLITGVKVIDAFCMLGAGQRIGIFGSPGAGKSSLLGALARNSAADICVLALIGERGRELREFLDRQLPPEFRKRCVVITSTSDRPALERVLGAYVATATAEYFRDQGMEVVLLFDSMTRFARAQRELGLAAGEQPVRRGFTPSVYAELPKLIERSGRSPLGGITAIYTVLLENDGLGDPIAEEVKSLTDGHIMLSDKLGQSGHYPAVDVLASTSRLMNEIASGEHRRNAARLRALMAKYNEIELLVQVGEYQNGRDPFGDEALAKRDAIRNFTRQQSGDASALPDTLRLLEEIARHG